jgi:DNA/RNA endonuclease YhcR with UshA esterase domain
MALGTLGKQSFARPFANTSSDGELVYTGGMIDQVALTKNGGHLTLRMNNISIFIPAQAAQGLHLQKGENISVYGVVETYRGNKEIMVNSAEDIRISQDT